jgi:hypothetical protein
VGRPPGDTIGADRLRKSETGRKGAPPAETSRHYLPFSNPSGDCMDHEALLLGLGGLLVGAGAILATYYGPIAAIKKQRKLDEEREVKKLEREILENSGPGKSRNGPPVLPRV